MATAREATISIATTVIAPPDQVSCDLAGETVILSVSNSTYYGLDAVGTLVWGLLQERRTVRELLDEVLRNDVVEPDCCERDLLDSLGDMAHHGLIEVMDGHLA